MHTLLPVGEETGDIITLTAAYTRFDVISVARCHKSQKKGWGCHLVTGPATLAWTACTTFDSLALQPVRMNAVIQTWGTEVEVLVAK